MDEGEATVATPVDEGSATESGGSLPLTLNMGAKEPEAAAEEPVESAAVPEEAAPSESEPAATEVSSAMDVEAAATAGGAASTDNTVVVAAAPEEAPAAPADAGAPPAASGVDAMEEDEKVDSGKAQESSDGGTAASAPDSSSKKRKAKIVDDDDSDEDGTALAMVEEEPAAESSDDESPAVAAPAPPASTGKATATEKTSAKLQALFGDGSDDSDSDGGFQGFDATEFQREEPPPPSSKKKDKSKKSESSAPKKRRPRDEDEGASSKPMSEYEAVMAARKAKNSRKRRKKDSDGVGDAAIEAAVARVIELMEKAHDEDEAAVQAHKPATRKLGALKSVVQALNNVTYTEELIEKGVFTPLAKWLSPNPETGTLPNITIRNALIKILHDSFTKVTIDDIRASGIGKVLMILKESKQETKVNKGRLETIIKAWSSQIWGVVSDQSQVTVQDRQNHYQRLSSKVARRRSSTSEVDEPEEVRRPGQKGFIMRARVPVVLPRDYTHRPVSKISIEEAEAKIDKNQTQLKSMRNAFKDKLARSSRQHQHAKGINISGSVAGKGT